MPACSATDDAVWRYAGEGGFAIVTKDDDFRQRAFLTGAPSKVIWIRLGNCRTSDVERILRSRQSNVDHFLRDAEASVLVLSEPRRAD
jgi:predicted nuclease of predicted toxin-antitoxin system